MQQAVISCLDALQWSSSVFLITLYTHNLILTDPPPLLLMIQAEILGQTVTWLVPHQLAQVLPVDVDYRVMLTFLEFYETMLQFVNFKLYNMLTVRRCPYRGNSLIFFIHNDLFTEHSTQSGSDACGAEGSDACGAEGLSI